MTKEYLQDRVNSFSQKIEKAKSLIEKKQALILKKKKQLNKTTDKDERYWLSDDIESLEDDIKKKQKELKTNLIPSLEKYKAELSKVQEHTRDIPVLVKFLDDWKQKTAEYYIEKKNSKEYEDARKEVSDAEDAYFDFYRNAKADPELKNKTPGELKKEKEDKYWIMKDVREDFRKKYGVIQDWESSGDFAKAMEKDLQKEWENKYDKLVADCTEKIGNITDCEGLRVSSRGELNGIIEGDKGRASVYTFLAAGPIQRIHYRCKVTKLKD